MLIMNPLKPFYKDTENRLIRMGNFKDSAKEIEYEDESLIKLFKNVQEPISQEDLIDKLKYETGLTEDEIIEAIKYLMEENFIINYEDYMNLLDDDTLNRQNLFFSMSSEKIKEWKLNNQPNILILGLGGVGSNVAVVLSRAGFTHFTLVDCDKVEVSNLIRQLPYNYEDVGQYKTFALKNKIETDENIIKVVNKRIEADTDIEDEIAKSDFVICTLDKPARVIRRLINGICVKYNKPVIFSGFSEHVAMIGPFIVPGKSACLKCIEKDSLEEPLNNVKNTPSYGPLCFLISSIVSNEVINFFYNFNKNTLIGQTLMFDILNYDINIIKWKRKTDCKVCGNDNK